MTHESPGFDCNLMQEPARIKYYLFRSNPEVKSRAARGVRQRMRYPGESEDSSQGASNSEGAGSGEAPRSRSVDEVIERLAGEIVEEQIRDRVVGSGDRRWLLKSACQDLPTCAVKEWEASGDESMLRDCLTRRLRNLAELRYLRTVQYSTLRRKLINRARSASTDPSVVEDIVQTVLERGIKGASRYRGDCTYETWLTSILYNVIRDQGREAVRLPVAATGFDTLLERGGVAGCGETLRHFLSGPTETPEKKAMARDILRKLFALFQVLLTDSYSYRAIYLTFVECLPPEDVARILGVTLPHYYKILSDARKKLRRSSNVRKLLELEGIDGKQAKRRGSTAKK